MKLFKRTSWTVLFVSFCALGSGVLGTATEHIRASDSLYSTNLGIFLGFGAQITIGLLGMLVADALIKIEKRLSEIEKNENSNAKPK